MTSFFPLVRDKIKNVRYHEIDQIEHLDFATEDDTPDVDCQLNIFSTVSSSELLSIIGSASFKSSDLDPVPGQVLKCILPAIFPVITKIVNLSLESGRMPELLKQAVLKPLLKKPSSDPGEFKNFRPLSNLPFISKIIEKCVAKQLIEYLDNNGFGETFHSDDKRNHSTETALIRVHNDIVVAIDQQNSVIL